MPTTVISEQRKAIGGPISPKVGIKVMRRSRRKAELVHVLKKNRFCSPRAAKRY